MFQDILKGSGRSSVATNLRIKLSQRQKESSRTLADQMADELASVQFSKKIFVFYKGNEYAITDCVKTSGKALLTTSLESKDAVRSNWLRSELLQCSGLPVKIEINGKEVDPQDIKNDRILANKKNKAELEDLDTDALESYTDPLATMGGQLVTSEEGSALLSTIVEGLKNLNIEVSKENIQAVLDSFESNLDLFLNSPKETESASLSEEDLRFKQALEDMGLNTSVSAQEDDNSSRYIITIKADLTVSQVKKLIAIIKDIYGIKEDLKVDVNGDDDSVTTLSFDLVSSTTGSAAVDEPQIAPIEDPKKDDAPAILDDGNSGMDDDGYSDVIFLSASFKELYDKCDWTEISVETDSDKAYTQLIKSLSNFNGEVVSNPDNKPTNKVQSFKTNDETGLREFISGIKNNQGINLLANKSGLRSRLKTFFLV